MKQGTKSQLTKRALAAALKQSMAKKPFSKITVQEIISKTDINRNTFYYHFEDMNALFRWMIEDEVLNVVRQFDLLVDYEETIEFIMNYVLENDHMLNCALDSIGRDGLKFFFYKDFEGIAERIVRQAEQQMNRRISDDYRAFLVQFCTGAIASYLIDWIKEKEHQDKHQTIEYISTTIKSMITGAIGELGSASDFIYWQQ